MTTKSNFDLATYTALTPKDSTTLLKMFKHFTRVTAGADIEWWGQCGTMLGAVRCGGLVRWDDDIDVAMSHESFDKLRGCRKQLECRGEYKVKYVGQYCKLEHVGTMDATGEASLWIDIFKVQDGIYSQKHCQCSNAPDNLRLPLRLVKFSGIIIYIPNKAEELLDIEFKDWRTKAVVYNHRGPKTKTKKGVKITTSFGGYQHFGTYPLTPDIDKPVMRC